MSDTTWTACPDGEPQEVRHPLGFRERDRCELELRVPLGDDDSGVCQVMVDEHDDEVDVRVLVHRRDDHGRGRPRPRPHVDCPVRVWLERPLGDRAVINADTDQELLYYVPAYVDDVPRADHGYHWGRPR
ncbi:MAG TPA: hypothetical protein VFN87_21725 [Solirubrobacteraceae bacterium]|nr:hypothetical protein [Solirubrobacteraceae bacterium]